jgi:hypothetical protein
LQQILALNMILYAPSQGGSGIRMLDRGLVGWLLPEARKKEKGPHQFFV